MVREQVGMKKRREVALRGFTLIELLVVVAIIALLIAILLPSLGRARSNARVSACLANMHAFGQASVTYNAAYDGYMVPATYDTDTGNSTHIEYWETIFLHDGFIGGAELATDPKKATDPTSTDQAFHRRSVFHCPEEFVANYHRDASAIPSEWYDANKPVIVDSWYYLNGQAQQYSNNPDGGGSNPGAYKSGLTPVYQIYSSTQGTVKTSRVYAPKFSGFAMPQDLVLAAEADSLNLRNMSAAAAAPPTGVGVRWFGPHNDGKVTNLVFVDGHATRRDYKLYPTTSAITPGLPMGGPLDTSGGKDIHWFTDKYQ